MIIAVKDKSYRCKDCDSFGQCEYYNNRRPTSHICKEFTNDSKVAEILDKISAEIKELPELHCIQVMDREDIPLLALDIIEKYKGDSK